MTAIGFLMALIGQVLSVCFEDRKPLWLANVGVYVFLIGICSFVTGIAIWMWRVAP